MKIADFKEKFVVMYYTLEDYGPGPLRPLYDIASVISNGRRLTELIEEKTYQQLISFSNRYREGLLADEKVYFYIRAIPGGYQGYNYGQIISRAF